MKNIRISGFLAVGLLLLLTALHVSADSGKPNKLKAKLSGFQEVPASISTAGNGEFSATVNESETVITYDLEYADLEGGAVLFAHVHIGQKATAGGVMFFLCGGGGKPACPSSGKVTGTVVAADVIGPAGQGISPGQLAEAIRAMRAGAAYANVHTTTYPTGEIRGQIRHRGGPDK
ncbi:MAG: hypothetical protein DMG57_44690 [Acidobacteria bacterium]|nr:MAG: hypothetical protein DMG57_44690 [Acidobacteriota bacterium]